MSSAAEGLDIFFTASPILTFELEDICLDCDNNALVDALLVWIQQNALVIETDGLNNSSLPIQTWIDQSINNILTVTDILDRSILIVTANTFSKDCDILWDVLSLSGNSVATSLKVSILKTTGISASATIIMKRAGLPAPTFRQLTDNGIILCDIPDICDFPSTPLDTPYTIEFTEGATTIEVVTFETKCNEQISITCEQAIVAQVDCDGMTDETNPTCITYTNTYIVTGEQSEKETVFQFTFKVVTGGPCFDAPLNKCNLISKTPEDDVEILIAEEIAAISESVEDGCGRKTDRIFQVTASEPVKICENCCRGEVVYRITYTVTDVLCDLEVLAFQYVRYTDGQWERHFGTDGSCPCPPPE